MPAGLQDPSMTLEELSEAGPIPASKAWVENGSAASRAMSSPSSSLCRGLGGQLTPKIVTAIHKLNLQDNFFSGQIPVVISPLSNLQSLNSFISS